MDTSLYIAPDWQPFIIPLLVALIAFAAIWPVSVRRTDASLVDLAWAPGFAIQVMIAALLLHAVGPIGWLLVGLVTIWSARLGYVLIRRRVREGREDARYTIVRNAWGPAFWWKSFFIVFVLQAVLQWLIALGPISGVVTAQGSIDGISILGTCVAIAGLLLEARADQELDAFKSGSKSNGLLVTGLRRHVRHPNYMGEIIFWLGIGVICVSAGAWLGLISPVLITLFLVFVSGAPLLDERLGATRPEYASYKAQVPAFLPRLTRERNVIPD